MLSLKRPLFFCVICILTAFYGCQVRYTSHPPSKTPEIKSGNPLSALETVAREWLGVPYRYGGTDTNGIDCSALTREIYMEAYGIKLPRTTQEQRQLGSSVPAEYLRPGDLMFFRTNAYGRLDHVGIYLGDGKFIHASTSAGVVISNLDDVFYKRHFILARRYRP